MPRWEDQVLDEYKRPVPGADVYVFTNDGVTQVALTDDFGAPLQNPVETDTFGSFYFNVAAAGIYQLEVHYGGETEYKQTIYVGLYNVPDGTITTPKLADGAVTTPKLADAAVTYNKLAFSYFDSGVPGLVPASGGGIVNFLRADGTWAQPTAIAVWGTITGTLSNQTDLQTALNAKADATATTAALALKADANNVVNSFNTRKGAVTLSAGDVTSALGYTAASDAIVTSGASGLAPATGGGTANFLRADGTWAVPPGTFAGVAWGAITGTLSNQTDLQTALNGKAASVHTHVPGDILAVPTATLFYRKTAGTGAAETQTLATLKTDLGLTGTNSGDQTITLTGNVTGSGTGSFATTIQPGVVTLSMLANMATASVYYRKTTGTGAPEVQSLATLKTDLGLTGTNSGDQTITLTGHVAGSGTGSFATTIQPGVVTLAMQANVATARIMGRVTASTGVQEALTGTQATTLIDTFTSTLKGLAPASGGGTTNYLRADGTWAAPPGGGGAVSDTAYGASWNGDTTTAPSKNAVYDKIEAITVGGGGVTTFNTRSGAVTLTATDVNTALGYTAADNALKANLAGPNSFSASHTFDTTGGHSVKFGTAANGYVYLRDLSGVPELHIRPASGKGGLLSFTEDSIANRWAIGTKAGDSGLYFVPANSLASAATLSLTPNNATLGPAADGTGSPADTTLNIQNTNHYSSIVFKSVGGGGVSGTMAQFGYIGGSPSLGCFYQFNKHTFRNAAGNTDWAALESSALTINVPVVAATGITGLNGTRLSLFSGYFSGNTITLGDGLNFGGTIKPGLISNNTGGGYRDFWIGSENFSWVAGDGYAHFNLTSTGGSLAGSFSLDGPVILTGGGDRYVRATGANSALHLEQTGDALGVSRLSLTSRVGANGATIETALDVIDLMLKGPGGTKNIRLEQRAGSVFNALNAWEFQFGTAGAPSAVIGPAANHFTGPVYVPDDAYGAGWDGNFSAPSKNAVYDKIQSMGAGGVSSFNTRTGAVTLSSADVTDALTYTPANKAGDTFTGAITVTVSGTNRFLVDAGGATVPNGDLKLSAGSDIFVGRDLYWGATGTDGRIIHSAGSIEYRGATHTFANIGGTVQATIGATGLITSQAGFTAAAGDITLSAASDLICGRNASVTGTLTVGGAAVLVAGHPISSINVSATSRILGRTTAGAGAGEELTGAQARTIIGAPSEYATVTTQSTNMTAASNDTNKHIVFSGASRTLTLSSTPTAGTGFTGRFTTAWAIACAGGLSKNGASPTSVTTGNIAANSLITFLHEGSGVWVASGSGLT